MERADLKKLVLATGFAEEHSGFVFLGDSGALEKEATGMSAERKAGATARNDMGWLCLPTGGTSGARRFARHDEATVTAAVEGFCTHFGVRRVNALDVLPAYHVSGLMARIRCSVTGGEHRAWSWKQLEAGDWPTLRMADEGWFLSLVPTQLQRLLGQPEAVERLRDFRGVFIGGGPLWPELAEAAAAARVPVSVCYGMTETAAMVAAQRPGGFLAGDRSCGLVMPHARMEIVDDDTGVVLPAGSTGVVRISASSLFHGYWPEFSENRWFLTQDIGCLNSDGSLRIFGRRDAVIITGGEKVHPAEVEAALRQSGEFDDVSVIGLPDLQWGSSVTACYPVCARKLDTAKIERALTVLEGYKRPKRFLAISPWPRNAQGKLNRAALIAAASADVAHPE